MPSACGVDSPLEKTNSIVGVIVNYFLTISYFYVLITKLKPGKEKAQTEIRPDRFLIFITISLPISFMIYGTLCLLDFMDSDFVEEKPTMAFILVYLNLFCYFTP